MTSNPYKKGKFASESEDSSADIVKALQYHVHKICGRRIEEDKKNVVMSKDAVNALTEFTYHYATTCLANDLVMFSQHRKSKTVNADDVKLVARKDPSRLGAHLERCHTELIEKQEQSKKKKKSKNKVKVKDVHSSQDEHLKKMEGMNAMQKRDYLMNAAKSSSESEKDDSSLEDRIIFRQKSKSGIIRIDSDSNSDDVDCKKPKRGEEQFHVQVMSSSSSSSDDDSDRSSSASIDDKKPRAR